MSAERPPASLKRKRPSWLSPVWIVPLIAAGGLGYFVYGELVNQSPTIEISFVDGGGLEPGKTDLKYRGVKVGQLERVDLTEKLTRVVARVTLESSASELARRGSRFWIVRPSISAGGVKALGAVITGAYIGAMPGEGEPSKRFIGLEEPPAVEEPLRSLQIYVLSDRGISFDFGAPVYYGAIKVGAVADSSLSSDATRTRSRVVIEKPYQELVRRNSQFWSAGGLQAHLGLGGLEISAKSLTSLLAGGMAFGTPDQPGARAEPESEFTLSAKPKGAWLKWNPKIPLGPQPQQSER